MKLVFKINFNTRFGQNLFLDMDGKSYSMEYFHGGSWRVSLEGDYKEINYRYRVVDGDEVLFEAGAPRHCVIARKAKTIVFNDSWQGFDGNAPFLSTPFTDVFCSHRIDSIKYGERSGETVIRATIPLTATEERVFVCGSSELLGGWDAGKALQMHYAGGGRWEISFKAEAPFEYKFIRKNNSEVEWENGDNHSFAPEEAGPGTTLVIEHSAVGFTPRAPRIAGVAIPVFSLRSKNGYGIGDFLDIKPLVKWAAATGQRIIQLLPVNDTTSTGTWTDSYPYGGISIMALHPIYLNLRDIGAPSDKALKASFEKERKELNNLLLIDYERVLNLKMNYARAVFDEKGEEVCQSGEFAGFFERNRDWLLPYAAFCHLRDRFGTADFSKWGEYSLYDADAVEELFSDASTGGSLLFHCFIQFHLDRQLRRAREYAHSNGVALKGDIPIGITPHSVEAWKEPYYFNMDSQAGAPPDFFSADGQNWGFPTYNWDRMAQDGYLWWKKRFAKMAEYFDAYRIDHVLGFFRIWEIPQEYRSGTMGHFAPALPYPKDFLTSRGLDLGKFLEDPHKPFHYHPKINAKGQGDGSFDALYDEFFFVRHNDFWRREALKKLPALIASTQMLTCAEDLGMIPSCVPQVLEDLKILTLEIQRMPKDPNVGLGNPAFFPYMSVCTTGSHDTSTLRGWWGETHGGEECPADTCRRIIAEHLNSPSMLCILPWQDWTSIDETLRAADTSAERINNPANPKHYWRYRMHITLEELLENDEFNSAVAQMTGAAGRS